MKIRLIIFFVACLAIAIIAFGELWTKLPQWLSLEGLQRYGVFHWGVLVLCVLWLWMKRQGIIPGMQTAKFRLPFVLAGLVLLALSILLPWHDDLFLFPMLLGFLGAFTVIFSRAFVIPTILLAIYGFSVAFPVYMMEWLGEPSSMMVTSMVVAITQILGLPVSSEGSLLQFNSLAGENISTVVTPGCVGYYTIGVFIALYALMMLDIMLP